MHNQNQAYLVIPVLVVGLSFLLVSGFYDDSPSAQTVTQTVKIQPNFINKTPNKSLQINDFTAVSNSTSPITATPIPVTIDLNAPGFDWDDLQQDISYSSIPISYTCTNELKQAATIEDGDIGLSLTGRIGCEVVNGTPRSRVGLCLQDSDCEANGYDHYHGSQPLPVYHMSQTCQQQFRSAMNDVISRNPSGANPYAEIFNTNCDPSDEICDKNTYCEHSAKK